MKKIIPLYGIKIETNIGHWVWMTPTGTSPLRKKAKQFDTRAGAVMERNALAATSPQVRLLVEKLNKENPVKMKAVKAKIAKEQANKAKAINPESINPESISEETSPSSEVTDNEAPALGTATEALPVVETVAEGTSNVEETDEDTTPKTDKLNESVPATETVQERAESASQRIAVTEA